MTRTLAIYEETTRETTRRMVVYGSGPAPVLLPQHADAVTDGEVVRDWAPVVDLASYRARRAG